MLFKNVFFFLTGMIFLALAKVKNILLGYATPKPFDISETGQCIDYDIHVVDHWLSHLQTYTNNADSLEGKNTLELGPGSDLGIGIYLLAMGCSQYNACDVNNLLKSTPDSYYEQFFKKLEGCVSQANINSLKKQLIEMKAGKSSQLNYVVRKDFNLVDAFGKEKIDLVFSQAAFEHFDDIEATVSQLSVICKPGSVLVTEIDLQTHSRWIREKDPNNIYRYPSFIYNIFRFRGIPNRVRPYQYQALFENTGWTDVCITPLKKLSDPTRSYSGLSGSFADKKTKWNT